MRGKRKIYLVEVIHAKTLVFIIFRRYD